LSTYEEVVERQNEQLVEKEQRRATYEGDLTIEREWRASLKQLVDDQQEQITALQASNEELKANNESYDELMKRFKDVDKRSKDYELSLEELGVQLRDSKLEIDELKESSGLLKDAHWAVDKEIKNCYQCVKAFSVSTRKHHCRNCGNIFCATCSDYKLPLPSSKKPVRVCDGCHILLLERYSAGK